MKIKKVLKESGWQNQCAITFKKVENSCWLGRENGIIKPIIISLKDHNRDRIYHEILHEIFHVIIETKDNLKYVPYLREYRVEKLLRKVSKKLKLNNVVNQSNKWINYYQNVNLEAVLEYKPYVYAAKRIVREENLACTSCQS